MSEPDLTPPAKTGYWFRAKRYGWGWGFPCTSQGWLVLVVYLSLLGATQALFGREAAAIAAIPATLALLAVLKAKGEPPRWRWGGE